MFDVVSCAAFWMDFSLHFSLVTTLVLSLLLLTGLSAWTMLCGGLLWTCSRTVLQLVRTLPVLRSPWTPAYPPPSWDSPLLLLLSVRGGCSSPAGTAVTSPDVKESQPVWAEE